MNNYHFTVGGERNGGSLLKTILGISIIVLIVGLLVFSFALFVLPIILIMVLYFTIKRLLKGVFKGKGSIKNPRFKNVPTEGYAEYEAEFTVEDEEANADTQLLYEYNPENGSTHKVNLEKEEVR